MKPIPQSQLSSSIRLLLAAAASAALATTASAFELEMGAVTVNDTFASATWTNVTFIDPFDVPPVVVTLPTTQGGDPATLRIRNITANGFSIVITEPPANDGPHVAMETAYLAIEPGNYQFPDGTRLQAYRESTTANVGNLTGITWDSITFATPFAATPAVVATLQSANNETASPPSTSATPFLATAVQGVSALGLQFAIERAESAAGSITSSETIGIVAVDANTVLSFVDQLGTAVTLQSVRSANNIRGYADGCFTTNWNTPFGSTPIAVASTNTRAGNNGGWLRRCSQSATALGLTVDEDIDNDSERNHTNETAGLIGASTAFHANFDVEFSLRKTVQPISDPENGTTNPMSVPGSVVQYTIGLSNSGNASADANTVTITDILPDALALCVTAACQIGGGVVLDDSASPTPSGVTLGSVAYSNDEGATFGYTPNPDSDGFDPFVDAVAITLSGNFAAVATSGTPSVQLRLSARIN